MKLYTDEVTEFRWFGNDIVSIFSILGWSNAVNDMYLVNFIDARLGHWMLIGACVSLFGQLTSGLAATARALWAMTQEEDGNPRFAPALLGSYLTLN